MKLFNLFSWVTNLVEAFTFYGGSSGGGGGGGNQTSTSYSTNLPEYAKPYYEQLLKETGKQVYTTDSSGAVTGVKPMPVYTGERVAGFTPGQEAIQRETMGLTTPGQFGTSARGLTAGQTMGFGAGAAGLGQAFGYSPMAVSGGTFDAPAASYYMSPYQSNVTDIAVREARRQGDIERSRGALGAIQRGTFGGARQALLQSEQDRNLAQNIGDIRAKGQELSYQNAQQQFERDQARRMQAAQLGQQAQQFQAGLGKDVGLAGLAAGIDTSGKLGALGTAEQTANLERLKAQAATEGEKQALQQQINDMKYQMFNEQQNFQRAQLEYLSNILRGNAGALGSTQVQYTPQPSTASQIASLGLSGLALSKALS
jgi:hypothetical protein